MRNYIWKQVQTINYAQKTLESRGFDPETPWFITDVAGLQFYAADASNMRGELAHQKGGDIQLVRRPNNKHDSNAVEVWCDNGEYQCGHLPWHVARDIAPLLDNLKSVNALCHREYDGHTYSMEVMLFGKDIPEDYHRKALEVRVDRDEDYDMTEDDFKRLKRKHQESRDFDAARRKVKAKRVLDATISLFPDLIAVEDDRKPLDEIVGGDFVKRRKERGKVFSAWYSVPANLKARKAWRDLGYKPKKKAKPYAGISYYFDRREHYSELYHARDVEPIKRNMKSRQNNKIKDLFNEIYRDLPH